MFWNTKPPVGTPISYASPLARGLVAYFPLNEGAGERVNSNVRSRFGTVTGVTPSATSGWIGTGKGNSQSSINSYPKPAHGFRFDGTDDMITVNGFQALTTFSIAFWASDAHTSVTDQYNNAVSCGSVFGDSPTNFSCGIRTGTSGSTNRKMHCYWRNAGGTLGGSETSAFTFSGNDDWNHYAYTWDGTNIKFYLNGLLKLSTTSSGGTLPGNKGDPLKIGNSNSNTSTDARWNGGISEVMIYDRAVNDTEIRQIYANLYNVNLYPNAIKRYLNAAAAGGITIKTWDGLAQASIKTYDSLATASTKTVNGLSNV